MSRSSLYAVIAVTILLSTFSSRQSQCQTCYCTGDVNRDGGVLTVQDVAYLTNFVNSGGPPPIPLYQGDLNGDCAIDQADIELFQNYLLYGISVFPTYPVPTCCNPDTLIGACCDSAANCYRRTAFNCGQANGHYFGDGTFCQLPCFAECVTAPEGLLAWYPFDETSGNVADDIAGQHLGSIRGSPGSADGMVHGAYSFRWSNRGAVIVSDDPFQYVGTGDFTIDAWIYPEAPDAECSGAANPACSEQPIIDNRSPGGT